MTMNKGRLFCLVATIVLALNVGAQQIHVEERPQHTFPMQVPPGNYSGIAWLGAQRYAVVDDKSSTSGFHIFHIDIDSLSGDITQVVHEEFLSSGNPNRDEEGIAFVTADSSLFVSGEADNEVMEYDMNGHLTGRRLEVPDVMKQSSSNLGLEALTYQSQTGLFWTVTEAPLPNESFQRLQSFDHSLKPSQHWRYVMDTPIGNLRRGSVVKGIPALAAMCDGRLLVMEREFFVSKIYIGSFVECRLYVVDPRHAPVDSLLEKTLVYQWTTRLNLSQQNIANYEGMCLGPTLADGRQVLVLVSDSQNQYKGVLKDWFKTLVLTIGDNAYGSNETK